MSSLWKKIIKRSRFVEVYGFQFFVQQKFKFVLLFLIFGWGSMTTSLDLDEKNTFLFYKLYSEVYKGKKFFENLNRPGWEFDFSSTVVRPAWSNERFQSMYPFQHLILFIHL